MCQIHGEGTSGHERLDADELTVVFRRSRPFTSLTEIHVIRPVLMRQRARGRLDSLLADGGSLVNTRGDEVLLTATGPKVACHP